MKNIKYKKQINKRQKKNLIEILKIESKIKTQKLKLRLNIHACP